MSKGPKNVVGARRMNMENIRSNDESPLILGDGTKEPYHNTLKKIAAKKISRANHRTYRAPTDDIVDIGTARPSRK